MTTNQNNNYNNGYNNYNYGYTKTVSTNTSTTNNTVAAKPVAKPAYTKTATDKNLRDENKINVVEKKQFTLEELKAIGNNEKYTTAYRLAKARAYAAMSNLFAGGTHETGMGWAYIKHGSFAAEIAYVFSLLGLCTSIKVGEREATAKVFSIFDKDDVLEFSVVFEISADRLKCFTEKITYKNGVPEVSRGQMNIMQAFGAAITYYRRYLWFMILEMADCDALDDVEVKKQLEEDGKIK